MTLSRLIEFKMMKRVKVAQIVLVLHFIGVSHRQTWVPLPSWRGAKPYSLNFGAEARSTPPDFVEGHQEGSFPSSFTFALHSMTSRNQHS